VERTPAPSTSGTCGNRADPATLSGWWGGVLQPRRSPEFLDSLDKISWRRPCLSATRLSVRSL